MAEHRSIVKHAYLTQKDQGKARAHAHVRYIQFRAGEDKEEATRGFFSAYEENISGFRVAEAVGKQDQRTGALMHKLVLSPGVEGANMQEYTREVMADLCSKKGLDLEWYAVQHDNTDNPHCHIVVMGKDLHGRNVRLDKLDYTRVKEAGDRYLERNKLLSKERPRTEKERNFGEKLFDALKAAKQEFDRHIRSVEERKLRRFELLKEEEEKALGKAPDYTAIAAKREAQEEKKRKKIEEAWKYYAKPIDIKYGGESREFTWQSRLGDLRELERDYLAGKKEVKEQLKEEDFKRLTTWIKDAWYVEKRMEEKASKVESIKLKDNAGVSKKSDLADLKEVKEQHDRGDIVLSDAEAKALGSWIDVAEKSEPIRVKMPGADEAVMYDRNDSKETLEALANDYRRGEDWAVASVSKEEYKKLREWIKEKSLSEKLKDEEDKTKELRSER